MEGQIPEVKALVYTYYIVECPYCKASAKYEDFMSEFGTRLTNRFHQILSQKGGVTRIEGQCEECKKPIVVTSFLVK
jgi:hypothetical protein